MKSNSETGHAKNVANFQNLINCLSSYGTNYNPAKDTLKIPHLNTIAIKAQNDLFNVIDKKTNFNNAVINRSRAFENLLSLSTRLVNALKATDAPPQRVDDAKGFQRKMQGKRAKAIAMPVDENQPVPVTISTSQRSYDQQIQHFAGLISVLKSEESYKPNEGELKIETLTAKQNELLVKNNEVSVAHTFISKARIERNETFYSNNSGLVDTALEIKNYVKSAYGANSPQYKQISGIQFKHIKA
ncbi:hypothetical protein NAT51_07620 [Flavobacterium amniphilum]|uniref:hypothetical protein n=1 Tax=Flavobacterium amniphilum TaxID=1834035 RepID=UPI002029D8D7|nr:hypothetical protein [Flavobacterium amniphilum]MCL9805385.1 hypothetical protein [Flavobacterium amniphilum]